MKLCTFALNTCLGEIRRVGVESSSGIVDVTAARIALLERTYPAALARRVGEAQLPPKMIDIIGSGRVSFDWIDEAERAVVSAGQSETSSKIRTVYQPNEVRLLSPVPRPPGISNFSVWPTHIQHARDKGVSLAVPDKAKGPQSYWKGNADSFIGPNEILEYPIYGDELDVECEVVAVVGTGGKDLDTSQAEAAIAGYTIFNDVSVRSIQLEEMKGNRGPSKGKDFDGGNVLGPWLVTPDEVGNIRELRFALIVNNEEWSSADGSAMAFGFPELVSYLSRGQTLKPGHIVTCGCYPGGSAFDLERKIAPGDVVEMRVSKLGSLVNTVGQKRTRPSSTLA